MEIEIIKNIQEVDALVESDSHPGGGLYYKVMCDDAKWTCTCPSYKNRQTNCKHIDAVIAELQK